VSDPDIKKLRKPEVFFNFKEILDQQTQAASRDGLGRPWLPGMFWGSWGGPLEDLWQRSGGV